MRPGAVGSPRSSARPETANREWLFRRSRREICFRLFQPRVNAINAEASSCVSDNASAQVLRASKILRLHRRLFFGFGRTCCATDLAVRRLRGFWLPVPEYSVPSVAANPQTHTTRGFLGRGGGLKLVAEWALGHGFEVMLAKHSLIPVRLMRPYFYQWSVLHPFFLGASCSRIAARRPARHQSFAQ